MSMSREITFAEPGDIPAICGLCHEMAEHYNLPGEHRYFEKLNEAMEHGTLVMVCKHRGHAATQYVGMAFLQVWKTVTAGPVLFVEEIFVSERWRNQGIGREMMGTILQWGKESGFDHVSLLVHPGNHGANALYHSMGFSMTPNRFLKKTL